MPPQDERTPLREAIRLALIFAVIKFLIQFVGNLIAQHNGYGIFRDELYYIVCGRHPAFGYLDQPPGIAIQARITDTLFGHNNLALMRSLSALAGAGKLFLTGIITYSLGGRRLAQFLAMTGVLCAGIYLGIDGYMSMNSFEPVFWMTCMLAVIQIARGPDLKSPDPKTWWIIFGLSAGIGIENKHAEIFFLIALVIGIALSPQRRILASRWTAVAVGIIFLCGLPNLLWQIHYHFPTLQWLIDVDKTGKDVKLPPLPFMVNQIIFLGPLSIFIWLTGIIWLLIGKSAKPFRFAGITYLVFLVMMMTMHAKDYYLAPIYPVYFAGGGCAWELLKLARRPRNILVAAYSTILILGAAFFSPLSIPLLPPKRYIAFTKAIHFQTSETENFQRGPLPQFYADMFGWQDMADEVARVYNSLPPEDRARAGIFCGNYGEAGAVDVLARKYGIPTAISGHQSYWFWGPRQYTGEIMVIASSGTLNQVLEVYSSAEIAGHVNNPYSMPYEHINIYIARGRKQTYQQSWDEQKHWH